MSGWAMAAAVAGDYLLGNKQARQGNRYDYQYGGKNLRRDWRFAKKLGLTPQEFYGAGQPGGQVSGSGQVMGNASYAQDAIQAQLGRQTQLDIAQIQKDTATEVAEIQTGQQQKDLDQRIREFEDVTKPLAMKKLQIQEKELEKLTHDIATADPAFVRALQLLKMGPDNMVASFIATKYGVSDPREFVKLPVAIKEALIEEMIGSSAKTRREIEGIIDMLYSKFIGSSDDSGITLGDGKAKGYLNQGVHDPTMQSWDRDPNYPQRLP